MIQEYIVPLPSGELITFKGNRPPTNNELNKLYNLNLKPDKGNITQNAVNILNDVGSSIGNTIEEGAKKVESYIESGNKAYIKSKQTDEQQLRKLGDDVNEILTGQKSVSAPDESDINTVSEAFWAGAKDDAKKSAPMLVRVGVPIATAVVAAGTGGVPLLLGATFTGLGALT